MEVFQFGRPLRYLQSSALVEAVQSLFKRSQYCNVSLLILVEGDPCGICEAARCCDEKGDRHAFVLMEWELLDLGDRLRVSQSDRLSQ